MCSQVYLQRRTAKPHFGSSEKQVCLPASAKMNTDKSANDLTGLPKQSVPIQEKMLSCFFVFVGFRPDSCLPRSFSKLHCVHLIGKT